MISLKVISSKSKDKIFVLLVLGSIYFLELEFSTSINV